MMYHKNRLIKAYERLGCQLKVSYRCFGKCACKLRENYLLENVRVSVYEAEMLLSSVHMNLSLPQANNKGVGVIGVIECNFLDPTHNKQSFNETDKYR